MWEEMGVKFKVVEEADHPSVLSFLDEHFFPEEPFTRSLGVTTDTFLATSILKKTLRGSSSIMALDVEGRVLGVRIGAVIRRSDYGPWLEEWILGILTLFPFILPKEWNIRQRLFDLLGFSPSRMVAQLMQGEGKSREQETRGLYVGKILCSARWHGLRGLGEELLRRAEKLSQSLGCSHTYALVTGNYSAAIFDRLGYTKLKTLEYDKFRNADNQLLLLDVREHREAAVYLRALVE